MSPAELLLSVQLEQAGIPFEREVRFTPPRRFRADFCIDWSLIDRTWSPLLVEVEGGTWVGGRHVTGSGVEADCEKSALAAIGGFRFMRVTTAQVEDGRALQWIQQALGLAVAA